MCVVVVVVIIIETSLYLKSRTLCYEMECYL